MKMTFEIAHEGREYDIVADVDTYREHYGVDADGRRGVIRHGFEINDCEIWDDSKLVTARMWPTLEDRINEKIAGELAN